ncbi:hypothetical protein KUV95_04335 [Microbulbifer agarilyticus]|uniref:hypothetical protein n=1 Tax=Microbulbifer agarilyticus TaxID=260552 RepID=UPI001C97F355|nr:hypothetical protein [Microbulbifer agarilyticus]MBY6189497.1 hypothetical protein [Microbulbifer agarilyticus]MBY6210769.1 hypothetical protein [Microbulbifer agarilyticus]
MKKLLLPLIILLLIIGYFMSKKSDHSVDDAYDKMETPSTEETRPAADPTMPQESDDVAPSTADPQSTGDRMMDATKDAARDVGGAVKDAAEDTGDAVKDAARDTGDVLKDAAKDTGDALEDAGRATKDAAEDAKDAAEDAIDDMRDKDKTEDTPQQ